MIWLDKAALLKKISNDELSEKDGFDYLLGFLILGSLLTYFIAKDTFYWFKYLEIIAVILITVWGTKKTYEINLNIDGKDFIKRFLAISWVVFWKIFLYSLLIIIAATTVFVFYAMIDGHLPTLNDILKGGLFSFGNIIIETITYVMVIDSFKKLKMV